jgi:DNA-binding HxlR family transcriptional regulator
MESRTERVLRIVGSRDGIAILKVLLEAEAPQTALSARTKLTPQALERTLEALAQSGLVERLPGSQGPWRVTHWPETVGLLSAARQLSVALAGTDDASADAEREFLNKLEDAGSARPARKRGGPNPGRRDVDAH